MLSKCYGSNSNVTKGWFLKLNKDPVLEMTICYLPKCEEITCDTSTIPSYQTSDPKIKGLLFTCYFKLLSVSLVTTTTTLLCKFENPNESLTILNHYTNHL